MCSLGWIGSNLLNHFQDSSNEYVYIHIYDHELGWTFWACGAVLCKTGKTGFSHESWNGQKMLKREKVVFTDFQNVENRFLAFSGNCQKLIFGTFENVENQFSGFQGSCKKGLISGHSRIQTWLKTWRATPMPMTLCWPYHWLLLVLKLRHQDHKPFHWEWLVRASGPAL